MPGRHSSHQNAGGRRPWLAVGAGVVAVAAGAGAIALVVTRDAPDDTAAPAATAEPTATCEQTLAVPVVAAPAIADVVETVVTDEAETLGPCVTVSVSAEDPLAVAEQPVDETSPALWVADSSMWVQHMEERAGAQVVENLGSMASSPLVLAATPQAAQALAGAEPAAGEPVDVLWNQVLGGPAVLGVVDPESTTEGMATLATLETVLGGEPGGAPPETLVRSYVGLSRAVLPSLEEAFALTADPAAAPVFATTEQSVLAHTATDVLPVYPSQGTSLLDYPVLRMLRPGEPEGMPEAVAAVADVLLSAQATAAAQAAGFRASDGSLGADGPPSLPAEPPPAAPLTWALTQDALRTWSAVTLEARMLTVIDVSGSMDADAGQGRTRIELARDAAVTALRLYPDTAQIGLWAFSTLEDPPSDWATLVDLGGLSDAVGEGTRRDQLIAQARTLPGLVDDGGTGLYDTTLAAFRTVRAGYDPARVNSVVLLTDGRNEDDPEGIDLATLLRTLRTEFDPAQPVPIITIGMGPDADMAVLRQISETTGGKAYQALDPNDIETVFLDAMIERRCRPGC